MANPVAPDTIDSIKGWGAAILGLVGGAGVFLWKWITSGRLSQAGVNAQIDVISMLKEQLELERKRADDATAARDTALDQIRQLKDQIFALTTQVQNLEHTVKQATNSGTGPIV